MSGVLCFLPGLFGDGLQLYRGALEAFAGNGEAAGAGLVLGLHGDHEHAAEGGHRIEKYHNTYNIIPNRPIYSLIWNDNNLIFRIDIKNYH